jgi:hypothetical protein
VQQRLGRADAHDPALRATGVPRRAARGGGTADPVASARPLL